MLTRGTLLCFLPFYARNRVKRSHWWLLLMMKDLLWSFWRRKWTTYLILSALRMNSRNFSTISIKKMWRNVGKRRGMLSRGSRPSHQFHYIRGNNTMEVLSPVRTKIPALLGHPMRTKDMISTIKWYFQQQNIPRKIVIRGDFLVMARFIFLQTFSSPEWRWRTFIIENQVLNQCKDFLKFSRS